jgi:hypothetical protein
MFRAQHRAVNRKTFVIRLTGIFLLAVSGLVAFGWFVWLAPVRHLSDYVWLDEHTPKQTWAELQRELKNHVYYSHISGSFLELWGDKETAAWLIEEFKAGRTTKIVTMVILTWLCHLLPIRSWIIKQMFGLLGGTQTVKRHKKNGFVTALQSEASI